jgi:pSer/pThr/pTyr-binding forkhead associated (FHA) protein
MDSMKVVLVLFNSDGQQRSFSINHHSTTIGRRQDCDLRIPVAQVSRKHCRLVKDGQTLTLEDLDSSNGTYHNGQRVAGAATVQAGDSLQVGPVLFILQVDGIPDDEKLASIAQSAAQNQLHVPSSEEATAPPSGPQDIFDAAHSEVDAPQPGIEVPDDTVDLDTRPQDNA